MQKPPRILLIGLGRFGQQHLKTLKLLENDGLVKIAGVVVRTVKSKDKWAKEFKFPVYCIKDYDLNKLNSVDAVDIVTPSNTHAELAKRFLPHVNVFIEKPIAMDTNEALNLVQLAHESNHILMPGHIFRFHPVVKKMKYSRINT